MSLSKVHQELLDSIHPDGYPVPDGKVGDPMSEASYYHIMYVDIIKNKGSRSFDVAVFQKYSEKEWKQTLRVFEKHAIKAVTGHNEFAIVYDPIEAKVAAAAKAEKKLKAEADEKAKAEKKAEAERVAKAKAEAEAKAEVKSEPKKPGPRAKAQK